MLVDDAAVLPNFGKDANQSISFDTPRRSLRAAHIERIRDLFPKPKAKTTSRSEVRRSARMEGNYIR